eukprot:1766232-Amphidinium_carterae.1
MHLVEYPDAQPAPKDALPIKEFCTNCNQGHIRLAMFHQHRVFDQKPVHMFGGRLRNQNVQEVHLEVLLPDDRLRPATRASTGIVKPPDFQGRRVAGKLKQNWFPVKCFKGFAEPCFQKQLALFSNQQQRGALVMIQTPTYLGICNDILNYGG